MSIYLNDSVLIFLFLLGTKMQPYCVSLGEDNEHSLRWSCKVVVLWGNPELDLSLFVRKIVNHEPPQPLEYEMQCNRDCLGSRPLSSEVWALSLAVFFLWDSSLYFEARADKFLKSMIQFEGFLFPSLNILLFLISSSFALHSTYTSSTPSHLSRRLGLEIFR